MTSLLDRYRPAELTAGRLFLRSLPFVILTQGALFYGASRFGQGAESVFSIFHLIVVMLAMIWGGASAGLLAAFLTAFSIDYHFVGEIGVVFDSWQSALDYILVFVACVPALLILRVMESAIREKDEARRQVERTFAAKQSLLAVMAHDLRQPLSAASLQLEHGLGLFARDRAVLGVEALRKSQSNLRRMGRLIEDLLDESKMAEGRFAIRRAPVTIGSLLEEVSEPYAELCARQGVRFEKRFASGDLPEIELDADRITRVLDNLIGNALKFAPAGAFISLGASLLDDRLVVRVRNSGSEIAPADRPHVFEKNWQGQGDGARGTGLGLYVSRQIVEAHGGSIACESGNDAGQSFVEFMIALPVDPSRSSPREIVESKGFSRRSDRSAAIDANL